MEFTISLPEDLWSNPLNLLYILAITVPYGLFTHWTSLPAIKRYNREERSRGPYRQNVLKPGKILGTFLWRMTAQLPVRILSMALGILFSIGAILVSGIWLIVTAMAGEPEFPRGLVTEPRKIIAEGWKWRYSPKELYKKWDI